MKFLIPEVDEMMNSTEATSLAAQIAISSNVAKGGTGVTATSTFLTFFNENTAVFTASIALFSVVVTIIATVINVRANKLNRLEIKRRNDIAQGALDLERDKHEFEKEKLKQGIVVTNPAEPEPEKVG